MNSFYFLSTDDLPPQDRERSKTLPKSYGKKRAEQQQQNNTNEDSTKSLPRNSSSVCLTFLLQFAVRLANSFSQMGLF